MDSERKKIEIYEDRKKHQINRPEESPTSDECDKGNYQMRTSGRI